MKFEPTNYKFETGSFQIWVMFVDHTTAPIEYCIYKRAVDAVRDADEYARGMKSCGYDRANIVSFLICKVEVKEVVRLRKKCVPLFKMDTGDKQEGSVHGDRAHLLPAGSLRRGA